MDLVHNLLNCSTCFVEVIEQIVVHFACPKERGLFLGKRNRIFEILFFILK